MYIDIVSGFNARDLERMSSDGDLAIGDSTVETRTIPQTLQAIDILSESEDLLGMFCDCIVKNKSIGIYDGAHKSVELATGQKFKR